MRSTILSCFMMLVGGCSFLQDWGALRSGSDAGMGGMDAGGGFDGGPDFDGGTPDGGDDAGEGCNVCEAQGCDPSDTSVCVQVSGGCYVCDDPLLLDEGAECTAEEECEERLTCEQGLCLTPCGSHDDCAASVTGDFCGVGDMTEAICVARDCSPPEGRCEGRICTILYDFTNPGGNPNLGSICLPTELDTLGDRVPCDRSVPCADGLRCEADEVGDLRCLAYCFLDDPGASCTPEQICRPLMSSSPEIRFEDRQLGVCVADPAVWVSECQHLEECVAAGLGDLCSAGRCIQACDTSADCPADVRCVLGTTGSWCSPNCLAGNVCVRGYPCADIDSDSLTECYPTCDVSGACPAPHVCIEGVCVLPCSGPGDCPFTAPLCTNLDFDPATGECAPGRLCTTVDDCPIGFEECRDANGDGTTECVR